MSPQMRSTDSTTNVFICSAGHSGSTLLDLLLGSHSAAISLGEITQLPKNLALNTACACGAPVRECPLWSAVVERLCGEPAFRELRRNPYALFLGLFEAGTVVDRNHQTALRRLYRRLVYAGAFAYWRWDARMLAGFTAPLRRGARNKLALFRIVAELQTRAVLVDSSKHYLEAVSLYRAAPDRTKVVLLVRDGRAVLHAGLKRGHSRRRAYNAWGNTYERALPVLEAQVAAGDLLCVRYEDLAADAAQELHRLCEFIGIEYESGMLEFRSRRHHLVNGNDMRLGGSSTIRLDEAWKERLSDVDLDYFEARGGELNRRLGY